MENDIYEMIRDRADNFKSKESAQKESLRFWKSIGYAEDENLALLLDNQILFNNMATDNKHGEFLLKLTKKTWDKLESKNIVSFSTMTGPTGLIYSVRKDKERLEVDSHVICACTKKFETLLTLPATDEEEITILDKDTFEPTKMKCKVEHVGISECDLLDAMSTNFAKEIDNEIIIDLLNNATTEDFVEKFVHTDNVVAVSNYAGLKLLIDSGFEEDVLVNDVVGNNILFCQKGSKLTTISAGYYYCPYVFIASAPRVVDPQGFIRQSGLIRYGKKLTDSSYYHKMSF